MENKTKLSFSSNYELISFENQSLLLPAASESITNNTLFTVDELGGEILDCIKKTLSLEEIIAYVSDNYAASKETITKDVSEFIDRLIDNGIVIAEVEKNVT